MFWLFDLRADAAILKSVINDFGLFAFTNNGECFYSESLNTRMQPLDEKRAKLSDAGKRGNERGGKMVRIGLHLNRHLIIILSPPNRHPIATQSPNYRKKRLEKKQIIVNLKKPLLAQRQRKPNKQRNLPRLKPLRSNGGMNFIILWFLMWNDTGRK